MTCLNLRADTVDGGTVDFIMTDLPTPISENEFVLLGKPQSPICNIDYIKRGDPESGLYEGDVIKEPDGSKWLICYERGFYAINADCQIKHFENLHDWRLTDETVDLPIMYKREHLFKYKTVYFKLRAIVGAAHGKLLIDSIQEAVEPALIQMDCCRTYNNERLFLGNHVGNGIVTLRKGRLVIETKDKTFEEV